MPQAFVKALLTRTYQKASVSRYAKFNINGQVLMCTKVIDNAGSFLAIDHISIKTPVAARPKIAYPSNGLAS